MVAGEPMGLQGKLLELERMVVATVQMPETDQQVQQIEVAVAVALQIHQRLAVEMVVLALCTLKFHLPILQHSLVA